MKQNSIIALRCVLVIICQQLWTLPIQGSVISSILQLHHGDTVKEALLCYNKPEECFHSLFNLYRSAGSNNTELSVFNAKNDIGMTEGNLEWIVFSKPDYLNGIFTGRLLFVSEVAHNPKAKEIKLFTLPGRNLADILKYCYIDSANHKRTFIVVITTGCDEDLTCNFVTVIEIFQRYMEFGYHLIEFEKQISYISDKKSFLDNAPEVIEQTMPTKIKNRVRAISISNSDYIAIFSGESSLYDVKNSLSCFIYSKGGYYYRSIDEVYSVGNDLSVNGHGVVEKIFFRQKVHKNKKTIQICFTEFNCPFTDGNAKEIEAFTLSGKDSVVSVFGYNWLKDNETIEIIAVISRSEQSHSYYTNIYTISCGQRCCYVEEIVFENHHFIFRQVKTYEDFLKTFPAIKSRYNKYNHLEPVVSTK